MVEKKVGVGQSVDARAARSISPILQRLLFTENGLRSISENPKIRRDVIGGIQEEVIEKYSYEQRTNFVVDLIDIAGGRVSPPMDREDGKGRLAFAGRVRKKALEILEEPVVDLRDSIWVDADTLRFAYTKLVGHINRNISSNLFLDLITLGEILKPHLFQYRNTAVQLQLIWDYALSQVGEETFPDSTLARIRKLGEYLEEPVVAPVVDEDISFAELTKSGRNRTARPATQKDEPHSHVDLGDAETSESVERMTDREFGDLLAGLNTEIAAVVLTAMNPGEIYSDGKFKELMRNLGLNTLFTGHSFANELCIKSFVPFGLARVTYDSEGNAVGFSLTEKGATLGKSLAGHLLDFSERHTVSLYQLLGITNSTLRANDGYIVRSPLTRMRIYGILLSEDPPGKQTELTARLKKDYASDYPDSFRVVDHLGRLASARIVDYDSRKKDEEYMRYSFREDHPDSQSLLKRKTMATDIYTFLQQHPLGSFSAEEIIDGSILKEGDTRNKKELIHNIRKMLSALEAQGFIEKHDVRKGIKLSSDQRRTLDDFIGMTTAFMELKEEFTTEGIRKAHEIVDSESPERFLDLVRKHIRTSK